MTPTSTDVRIDARQQERLARLDASWEAMTTDPGRAAPKILIKIPTPGLPTPEEQGTDADLMLDCELAAVQTHLDLEDDNVPSVRVQFGTAQVAHAFGCPLECPTASLPAAKGPAVDSADAAMALPMPALDAGLYATVAAFHRRWRERLPAGVRIQHPDIQSPFNSAHLIRGNDLLTDIYDRPDAVESLLDKVTDYMIRLVPELNRQIGNDGQWFDDWGCRWKGRARISNCSMHLISPQTYRTFVLQRDLRLMSAVGGGRIHYCGTHRKVVDWFLENPDVHGLDVDPIHHDFWELAPRVPERMVLATTGTGHDSPFIKRLLAGDWPKKRNLAILAYAPSLEAGRELLAALRRSIPN